MVTTEFDLNYLRSKYPYLATELQHVADSLKSEELKTANEVSDLTGYQGPDYNRINVDEDDVLVIHAKLRAQKNWIDNHV